jgi:tripartite-type tricarboxylate transporter receptor subunit TctC
MFVSGLLSGVIMQRLCQFLLCLVFAIAFFAIPVARAQTSQFWPQRPVRFIIPLGPGSGVDITARLADKFAAKWGQPVVVENRPGGDAFVAITAVLGAHDDHMLLFAWLPHSPPTRCCMRSCLTIRKNLRPSRA